MKTILNTIKTLFVFTIFALFLTYTSKVQAQVTEWTGVRMEGETVIQEGNGCVAGVPYQGQYFEAATIKGFECLMQNILASATTMIGLISFVMVIVGAFYYLTSGGNSSTLELGKKSITYGIIGIIVALLAYFILFLIADFTGVDRILQFNTQVGN